MARGKRLAAGELVVALGVIGSCVLLPSGPADGHGTMESPASRAFACDQSENSDNEMCQQAMATDPEAVWWWSSISRGMAYTQYQEIPHEEVIPDGELCSAGRWEHGGDDQQDPQSFDGDPLDFMGSPSSYAVLNEPGNWPLTHLEPGLSGAHELIYHNAAPHSSRYYRVYITRPGFDATVDELGWDDLVQVYETDAMDAGQSDTLEIEVELPDRSEPAILYTIWHRYENEEAFYSCSDVTVSGGFPEPDGTAATTSTAAPATTTTTVAAAEGEREDDPAEQVCIGRGGNPYGEGSYAPGAHDGAPTDWRDPDWDPEAQGDRHSGHGDGRDGHGGHGGHGDDGSDSDEAADNRGDEDDERLPNCDELRRLTPPAPSVEGEPESLTG